MSKNNFEFLYKIFSAFSFFSIYLLVFNSSVYISPSYLYFVTWLVLFYCIWSGNPELPLSALGNWCGIIISSFTVIWTYMASIVFQCCFSVRYDLTRIFTLLVGDFRYIASGWTKWTSLSWIIKMKVIFWDRLEILAKLIFIFFQIKGTSDVASN